MNNGFTVNGLQLDSVLVPRSYFNQSTLWTWGLNSSGQLGDNTTINKSSPILTVASGLNWKQISAGSASICGIKTDGTLWLWGANSIGQLGTNTTINRSSPVQTISGGSNWRQISTGGYPDSLVVTSGIKTDGTLWTWGYNISGGLGDNTNISRSSPVQTVSGGTTWNLVSASNSNCVAVKTDGTLWCWGSNILGSCGDGTTTVRSSPVQTVAAGTNWKFASINMNSTAAIKNDGTLWTWGRNLVFALGDGTNIDRSSPVQTIASGTNWQQVSVGYRMMAAIKTDGTLWAWGSNGAGQLGDNSTIVKSSPVQTVSGGTNWKQVSAGLSTDGFTGTVGMAALKTDGSLWIWGYGALGGLGNNSTINVSSPIQTVAGGYNWSQVALGSSFSAALNYIYN